MYNVKSFKGTYNGKPYDSELEATWYSFLDKLRISYQVPQSSQGFNGCIPDLIIKGSIIAEIKPIDFRKPEEFTKWIVNLAAKFNKYRKIPQQADKAQLILGNGLNIYDSAFLDYSPIGFLRLPTSDIFSSCFVTFSGEFLIGDRHFGLIKAKKLEELWQQSEDDVKAERRLKEAFGHLINDGVT